MLLKRLALLTTVVFIALIVLGLFFNVPMAYVPENPSFLEFVSYHIIFMLVETFVIVALFLHMLKTANLDLDTESLKEIFVR